MVADPGGVDPDLDHKFNLKLNSKHLDPLRNPQVEIDRIQKQSPDLTLKNIKKFSDLTRLSNQKPDSSYKYSKNRI